MCNMNTAETPNTAPASRGKTWALKCATGLDVRDCGLTEDEAQLLIETVDNDFDGVVAVLTERGAKGNPRVPKGVRDKLNAELHAKAHAAGHAAAEAHQPMPMIVVERESPLDDSSPIKHQYAPVAAGVCGFAWVNVKPGNSSFARWLKDNGVGRPNSHRGGVDVWVSGYEQSMERKQAYAHAYANVLRESGIEHAWPGSRMD